MQSVKQVKENGLLVNELARTNLEKVEELYLHTIEQNKKIEQLSEENKLLKRRLDALEKLIQDKVK